MTVKPLKILSTRTVSNDLREQILLITAHIIKDFTKHPYDMFVLEPENSKIKVRVAGYDFNTGLLDEETIIETIPIEIPTNIWFKVDDYGSYYVGTFLYPNEY